MPKSQPPTIITVFGGSQPRPGEPAYRQALTLGKLLASQGWAVQTGGYIGTMEAVSRGAAEAGGQVIGVTCDEIETWRPVQPNPWLQDEVRFVTTRERLFYLVEGCQAALALPGGIGTLAEIAFMWSQLQTGAIAWRPLILIGPQWQTILDTFISLLGEYVPEPARPLIFFEPEVEAAADRLAQVLKVPGGKSS